MLEYCVLTDDTESGLEERVNLQLAEGWSLQGGVAVGVVRLDSTDLRGQSWMYEYAQAMRRKVIAPLSTAISTVQKFACPCHCYPGTCSLQDGREYD